MKAQELKNKRLIGVVVNHDDLIEKMVEFDNCVFDGVTMIFRFNVTENTNRELRYFPLHFYDCVFFATTLDVRVVLPSKIEMPDVEIIFKNCLFDKGNFRIVSNMDLDSFDINDKETDVQRLSLEVSEGLVKYTEVVKIARATSIFNANNFIKI